MFHRVADVFVTLCCWSYFLFGFLLFFSPFYLFAACSRRSEYFFQRFNNLFYRGFFALLRAISPRQRFSIDPALAQIRSSVVVCNHLSYLDPLLLIASLGRAKTIVKPVFFSVPIFGQVLRKAGYFPATGSGRLGRLMLDQMETLADYFASGGNLFIFPQGTRRRDGRIGELNRGALKIARYCRVPVTVLCIENTERLFTPGKFFFSAWRPNHITLRIVDTIAPEPDNLALTTLEARVRQGLQGCVAPVSRDSPR
ncbi:MAG: lysophospholipid acyltransferase family protein [Desulfopila sp.]